MSAPVRPVEGGWEWSREYSRVEIEVIPVVTAVEGQADPLSRAAGAGTGAAEDEAGAIDDVEEGVVDVA